MVGKKGDLLNEEAQKGRKVRADLASPRKRKGAVLEDALTTATCKNTALHVVTDAVCASAASGREKKSHLLYKVSHESPFFTS